MKFKFVVQEFEACEGWFDLIEFDELNPAFDYINDKFKAKRFFQNDYRIVLILFDTQKETIC